jgi:hypothetical protein
MLLIATMAMLMLIALCVAASQQQQQCDNTNTTTSCTVVDNSWITPPLDQPTSCDFRTIQLDTIMTPYEFYQRFILAQKPALLKGACKHWKALSKWTKPYLLEKLKNMHDPGHPKGLADILTDKQWHIDSDRAIGTSLAPAPYLFSKLQRGGAVPNTSFFPLKEDIGNVQMFHHWKTSSLAHFLLIGGQDSGLGFHNHRQAFCGLITGVKRWFIIAGGGSNPPPPQWRDDTPKARAIFLNEVLPTLDPKPLECYQHEGDVLFVPEYFPHTVYNVGETVAVSAVHLGGASEF